VVGTDRVGIAKAEVAVLAMGWVHGIVDDTAVVVAIAEDIEQEIMAVDANSIADKKGLQERLSQAEIERLLQEHWREIEWH
jgi:hypothetical protein